MKVEQIFHHYEKWEDWKAGMYRQCQYDNQLIDDAKSLLSSPHEFLKAGREMVASWKYAAEQNLTDKSQNRQAWVGQASCCFKCGVPEHLTRMAWREIENSIRVTANEIADIIIDEFEKTLISQKELF